MLASHVVSPTRVVEVKTSAWDRENPVVLHPFPCKCESLAPAGIPQNNIRKERRPGELFHFKTSNLCPHLLKDAWDSHFLGTPQFSDFPHHLPALSLQ